MAIILDDRFLEGSIGGNGEEQEYDYKGLQVGQRVSYDTGAGDVYEAVVLELKNGWVKLAFHGEHAILMSCGHSTYYEEWFGTPSIRDDIRPL